MRCHVIKHTLAFFGVMLLVSASHGAHSCEDFLQGPSKSQGPAFEFQTDQSVETNLTRFAEAYGVGLADQTAYDNYNPALDFPPGFTGISVSHLKPTAEGVEMSMSFGVHDRNESTESITTKPVFASKFPYPEFLGEVWKSQDQSFQFFNVGTRLLMKEADPEVLLQTLAEAHAENPEKNITVPFDKRWAQAKVMLDERQVLASSMAVGNYEQRKPYLAGEDLLALQNHDSYSKDDNDFFILAKDTGKSPLVMTSEELRQNMAVILRIARVTSADTYIKQLIAGTMPYSAKLPHDQRLRMKLKPVLQKFFSRLSKKGKLRIAELSRWNRFAELPPALMDAFLLKVFQAAKVPGSEIDLFILEGDQFTSKLFQRYGFKTLVRISESGDATEYLMYMDTHSPEYEVVTAELAAKSKDVVQSQELRHPPRQQWSSFWPAPRNFEMLDGKSKGRSMRALLDGMMAATRSRVKMPPVGLRRADRILAEVLEGQGSEFARLAKMAKDLSPAQRDKLLSKAVFFSKEFQQLVVHLSERTGSKEKIVILGENAVGIASLLKAHFPDRTIVFAGSAREWPGASGLDKVFVLNDREASFEKIAASLKIDGNAIFVDQFQSRFGKKDPSLTEELNQFTSGILQNKVPMTELELGLVLVLQKQILVKSLSSPYNEVQFLQALDIAGFETSTYGGNNLPLLGGQAKMFRKRD